MSVAPLRDLEPREESDTRPPVLVGLMSGTSLDGVSAAMVRFHRRGRGTEPELLGFVTRSYDSGQRARLASAMRGASPDDYCRLAFDVGHWLADAAVAVIAEAGVSRADISAVASHGHTVWHAPGHSTWQFGETAVIAERTGLPVIGDFRVRDMAAGGQGAPLVPIADALLFAHERSWRALQNLGGIGNVTIVPPGGDVSGVRAFDTGPGVGVLDAVARSLVPDIPYDVDGAIAAAGTAIEPVVTELLAAPYFASEPPKSTGRELFGDDYARRLIERCRAARPDAAVPDIVATAVSLTARSIADAWRRFVPEPVDEVLASGGGARNPVLLRAIAAALAPRVVRRFEEVFFDGDAKEAVAFAFLGLLHLEHRTGNVPSATGARGPRILGKLTPA